MPGIILTLDTSPPANPGIRLNDGEPITGALNAWVTLSTDSQTDVAEMLLWGDVDPVADPLIQPTEAASSWQTYADLVPIILSPGDGRKRVYARLRDDLGNATIAFSDYIDLRQDIPVISIVAGLDVAKVSKVTGYDTATFTWQSTKALSEYQVRVVPSIISTHDSGAVIPSTAGSINTSGTAVGALAPITTIIRGSDLEIASPGNSPKIIKVFGKSLATGDWSV